MDSFNDKEYEKLSDLLVTVMPKKLKHTIHRSIYELAVELRDPSTTQLALESMDPMVIDLFLRWWHAQPTTMHFSIRHLFCNDDVYKKTMCDYLWTNAYRWLAFFTARTGININLLCDYVHNNSEHLLNFFHDQDCVDRDILVMTFQPSYAQSLRNIQYEASERCVFIKLDAAMLILWLYGSEEFNRQYQLQRSLSIEPKDIPVYEGQNLHVIDWDI